MKITTSLVFVTIISAVALPLGSGYSIGGIPRWDTVPTKLGDACASATDCNGYTDCTPAPGPGTCTCRVGFHADDTLICTTGDEQVDSTCKDGVGCEHLKFSECSTKFGIGKCQCLNEYHNDGGKCVKDPVPTKLGDSCATATDCNGNTECTPAPGPGTCTCRVGFHADDTLICTNGDEKVNSTCKDGVGCEHLAYSECITTSGTGTCQCLQGYSAEKDGKACVTGLHGFCEDDRNCKSQITETCTSTGNGTTCECKEGYREANDTCQAPNQWRCDEGGCQDPHAECVPPNENSTAIICMCKAPYELNEEGKCTDPVPTKLGDSCKTVTDCNGNTECTPAPGPGTCTCKDGFHGDDTLSCVEGDAIIGSACTHNLGCEKVPGLKCNGTDAQGKCTCNDGFHADGEGRNCVQDVGSPCNPSVGCFDPAAECKMNQMGDYTCQCREGFEAIGNICKRMDNGLHIHFHVEEAKDIDIEIDKI